MTGFEFDSPPSPGTNRSAAITDCSTCGGDRFVTVRLRSPQQTQWMKDHGITPARDRFHEEVAPCPACGQAIDVSYYVEGKPFRPMDPAQVREAISR